MEIQAIQHSSTEELSNISDTGNSGLSVIDVDAMKQHLQILLENGGPDPRDYKILDRVTTAIHSAFEQGLISKQDIACLKALFQGDYLNETFHGHVYRKPMGYAGDYLVIDRIYTHHKSAHPLFKKWDSYFHYCEAPKAVRNRKEYFKKQMLSKLKTAKAPLRLLDVASGPARDLHELYEKIDAQTLSTTCVDMDARAIAYATELCKSELDCIEFVNRNILRYTTSDKFDVIWSAGLFDYFDDRVFVMIIKKFLHWLKPGGEIIVGNFSDENNTRGYMEIFGEWVLIHRSKEALTRLALLAGAKPENIWVDQEPLGINLFLRITA